MKMNEQKELIRKELEKQNDAIKLRQIAEKYNIIPTNLYAFLRGDIKKLSLEKARLVLQEVQSLTNRTNELYCVKNWEKEYTYDARESIKRDAYTLLKIVHNEWQPLPDLVELYQKAVVDHKTIKEYIELITPIIIEKYRKKQIFKIIFELCNTFECRNKPYVREELYNTIDKSDAQVFETISDISSLRVGNSYFSIYLNNDSGDGVNIVAVLKNEDWDNFPLTPTIVEGVDFNIYGYDCGEDNEVNIATTLTGRYNVYISKKVFVFVKQ